MDNNNGPEEVQMINLKSIRRSIMFQFTISMLSIMGTIFFFFLGNLEGYNLQLAIYVCIISFFDLTQIIYRCTRNARYIFDLRRRFIPVTSFKDISTKLMLLIFGLSAGLGIWGTICLTNFDSVSDATNVLFAAGIINVILGYFTILLLTCIFPCIIVANATIQAHNGAGVLFGNLTTTKYNHKFKKVNSGKIKFDPEIPECIICYEHAPNCRINPCKHNAFCSACIQLCKNCPECRGKIDSVDYIGAVGIPTANETNA